MINFSRNELSQIKRCLSSWVEEEMSCGRKAPKVDKLIKKISLHLSTPTKGQSK